MRQEVAHQSFLGHLEADHLDAALLFGTHFGERAGIAAELDCERRGFGFDQHLGGRQRGAAERFLLGRRGTVVDGASPTGKGHQDGEQDEGGGVETFHFGSFPGLPQARSEIPLRNPRATGEATGDRPDFA